MRTARDDRLAVVTLDSQWPCFELDFDPGYTSKLKAQYAMNRRDKVELLPKDKALVKEFLLRILPPGNHRRTKNNELSTIAVALDRWFMRNYNFHVGLNALGQLLEEMHVDGYTFAPMGEVYDPDTKKSKPGPLSNECRGEEPYIKKTASYLFINVDPVRIRQLRGLTWSTKPNTNEDKLIARGPLQHELRQFLIEHLLFRV